MQDTASSLANKALVIAQSIIRWDEERFALSLLPSRTLQQKKRIADLNSSIDSYSVCLQDIGEIPTGSYINRANKAA